MRTGAGRSVRRPIGYHLPHETASHERTFMQWPTATVYSRDELEAVQHAVARIANAIVEHEPVVMLSARADRGGNRAKLSAAVELWEIPTDDLWCRDSGPTFVVGEDGSLAVAHLRFNGWGGKQAHDRDGQVAARVAERLGIPLVDTGLVGEQGGVEHDGAGLLLAHASSWIGAGRNAMPLEEIGERLRAALGGDRVVWAPGLAGRDITDFHIDALARFPMPGTVLIQIEDEVEPSDPWAGASAKTLQVLEAEKGVDGEPLRIVKLHGPARVRSGVPDFVASYINHYVCNGAVIAPEFGDARADALARETLAGLHPGRVVRMLDIDPIAEMGGGIHCATQQQPRCVAGRG